MESRRKLGIATVCCMLLVTRGTGTHASPEMAAPGAIGNDPAAEAVFSKCRDAWSRAVLPRSLRYVVDVSARTDREIDERYAGVMGSSPDDFRVDRFSASELERPTHPTGTNVFLTFLGTDVVRLNNDQRPTNILGTPQLSPRFSFGLERRLLAAPDVASPSPLAVIGRVTAASRTYDIRLLGTEQSDGTSVVHLGLRPLREPRIHRLRELWVDAQTGRPIRAIVAGNFTDGPSLGVAWSITFQTVDGVSYIGTEAALAPLFFSRTKRYENVVVSFVDLQPSADRVPPMSTFHGFRSDGDLREPE